MRLNPLDRRVRERDGFPELPGAFPLLGHLPSVYDDVVGLMRHAAATVGPLFWLDLGFANHVLVCLDEEVFSVYRNKTTTSRHFQRLVPVLLGTSLVAQDGPAHHHLRSAMNGPFTPRGLAESETGAVLAAFIEARVARWRGRREVTILAETRELALSLIFRMLGMEVGELQAWSRQYERFVLGGLAIPIDVPGSPRWQSRRGRAWLTAGLQRHIRRAREQPGPDLLSRLVHARDEEGRPLGEEELIDNLLVLTFAGHETTASIMAWVALHVADDPALWRQLVEEARTGPVPRSPKELRRFPFSEALFREALRMHVPVPFDTREVIGPLTLRGQTVPVGTRVAVPAAYLSRDPARYPDPDTFRPARWLDRREPLTPLETLQFGGGPHFCLGYHVAWMEVVQFCVALGRLLPEAGLAPRLRGRLPRTLHLPLSHPPARTRLLLAA